MKTCVFAAMALLVCVSAAAQRRYTDTQVIAYAKSIDVKTLDPTLPSERLDDWLQNGPPHAQIEWDVSSTCDNKPWKNEEYPLCAKVWFKRDGQAGSLLVEVGTNHKGIRGQPQLYNGILGWEDGGGWIMTGGAEKLAGLPGLLDEPAYAHVVGELYEQIIARHPIGAPEGKNMAAIRPLLSVRLAGELEAARKCEAEYLRDASGTIEHKEKPVWLKSDVFSGGDNRVAPTSAWPVREGQQKDGSFLVLVDLFGQTIDLGNGLKGGAYSPTGTWHVHVKVVSEGGRFVVDDVRLFDGNDTDGPSHLLSESLAGCSSSHLGAAAQTGK